MLPSGKQSQKTMERSTMLLMGKSTIFMAIFHSFLYVYQRAIQEFAKSTYCGPRGPSGTGRTQPTYGAQQEHLQIRSVHVTQEQ